MFATVSVVATGALLDISRLEWALLALSIGAVWAAESINTALEWLVDLVHPEWATAAGRIKDVAAGGVLAAAIGAAVAGGLVFWPYLVRELG